MEASITLRNVSKFFKKKYVLSNLTLGIEKDSFFAIIGRNGAGKSILLRVISTFMMPDAGEVFINGKDVAKSPALAKNCIGYLPDHDIFDCWITGWENLRARAELLGIPPNRFQAVTEPLISDFNLQEVLDECPVTYSRGAKRCLDLVLVLLGDPQILILDEPTLGLDYRNRASLFKYLLSIKNRKTIIVASNEFTEVQTLAERWIVLDYGKIRFDGTLEKMLTRVDVPFSGEIILRKKDETLLGKIMESGNFSEVYDLDLTIRLTFEKLQDFYDILTTIPDENLAGVTIQSLSIAEFINRLLSDEELEQ
ncbi:MAG TPA: ABC transporter ATP-binding protein [Candidatus Marinimicrobia bacterium]|nr:ABC transporter ATP-binding protein [Candidatus Neomarinimicrobiota bacterium]